MQPSNKAPGIDKIDLRILKNINNNFNTKINKIYNTIYNLGHFPNVWKKASIIFFRKRNKNGSNPSSYRPISLFPVMGKILGRIIKTRTMMILENSNYFDDSQHGFSGNRNAITIMKK